MGKAGCGYTDLVEKNTTRTVLTALIAISLTAPLSAQVGRKKAHKAEKPAKAAKHKKSARKVARGGSQYVELGMDNLDHREYSAAIANFQKAAKIRSDAGSYFLLGYAHYQRGFASGAPETADKQDALETVNSYMMALAIDPTLSEVAQPHKLYHSLAMSYEALGSYDKAIDAYKNAIAADRANPMLPLYEARLRHKMGELDKSAADFEAALNKAREMRQEKAVVAMVKTNPLFSFMLQNPAVAEQLRVSGPKPVSIAEAGEFVAMRDSVRGTTPAEQPRRPMASAQDRAVTEAVARGNDEFKFRKYRAAIEEYQDALANNSNSGTLPPTQIAFLYERIGTCYNKLGLAPEAIRYLRKAVQDAPMASGAHYQLALAYSVSGHYQESVKALKESFKNSPNGGELRKYMMMAKTDSELEPVRDLPAFSGMIAEYTDRARGSVSASFSLR